MFRNDNEKNYDNRIKRTRKLEKTKKNTWIVIRNNEKNTDKLEKTRRDKIHK